MRFSVFFVLILTSLANADTYKYVVYADKFPEQNEMMDIKTNAGYAKLQDMGHHDSPQPSENTNFSTVKNTDVVILEVTFKSEAEKILYKKLEDSGRIFLYEISGVVSREGVRSVEVNFSTPIPVDLNKDWSVKKSSE